MAEIENLFAFDFDDTIAITPSIIGVKRVNVEGDSDPGFRDWIGDHSLDMHEIENEDTPKEIVWFTSGDFARYEKAHREDLEYLKSNNLDDLYDFTRTASVDVGGSSPIDPIINILKQASSSPNSKVVIITARSGNTPMATLRGGPSVQPTNQQDIRDFLELQGVGIDSGNITTAGDIGQGPKAKVKAMESYIDAYNPKTIYFYDDNMGNVDAIADMCADYFPEVNIKTFRVGKDGSVSLHRECS